MGATSFPIQNLPKVSATNQVIQGNSAVQKAYELSCCRDPHHFFQLPDPAKLGIPDQVMKLSELTSGLVLVTGPAGNGKSTTLACLIDRINKTRSGHIITMEDPIEYIHRHNQCIVSQQEVASDTKNYVAALRAALRQAPNVLLLGEMRDLDTIETAMTAAETGQLIFSTLRTNNAVSTIDRIIDVFPTNQQHQIRLQLSMVLKAVVSQQLLPTVDSGIVPAFEIIICNLAVQNMIREEKVHQLDSVIFSGTKEGIISMDASIFNLCKAGKIIKKTALERCLDRDSMETQLKTI
ncbi:type IV pilus twitching motility protein PilT [Caproicibacterium sp. NSD3]